MTDKQQKSRQELGKTKNKPKEIWRESAPKEKALAETAALVDWYNT